VFINDLCDEIARSNYVLFADDIRITEPLNVLMSLLQADINSLQGWRTANYMKRSISETKVIFFSRKTT
jgi:hypothetical protein